jgi:hypothetical protein
MLALRSLALVAACLASACQPNAAPREVPAPDAGVPASEPALTFDEHVRPVLERRCVVCHGCYDAPCQLLLSSHDGAERGASKEVVYHPTRLRSAAPTRLGVDARSTAEWRAKGFSPVLPEAGISGDSVLLRMLSLGASHRFAEGSPLPADFPLDIDRKLACPTPDEMGEYEREHPRGGMPYGTAPLSEEELRTLATWAVRGADRPGPPEIPASARTQAADWELFLNGESTKERVVARYLFEHLFVAHLYFRDLPDGPFFRLVRSRTAPGEPIDEIATVRPYDEPGAPFWYRLRPIEGSLVAKTHIPYAIDAQRMNRLRELFLGSDWEATREPGWDPLVASNPFAAFREIPARSRYRFLLDDAHYFLSTFIKGPVCRGQVAVDVIEDRFFVAFMDPEHDFTLARPAFLAAAERWLELPAAHVGTLSPVALWPSYAAHQIRYLEAREAEYDAADPSLLGPSLDWLWDGDGRNPSAFLTVFRNFDNAMVVQGIFGSPSETAWVLDYPLLERIYYDLVVGYDVFGDAAHQIATRLYMDHLRMQAENLFLTFLPKERRSGIRAAWYVGAEHSADYKHVDRLHGLRHGTQVRFRSAKVVEELLAQIGERARTVAEVCSQPPCDRVDATQTERSVERALRKLSAAKGAWVSRLPEVSLLRVRSGRGADLLYTLARDAAHTNVAFMFGEEDRRVPGDDTLSVLRGPLGSYPNFFFEVDAAAIDDFVAALTRVSSEAERDALIARFGIRRTDPRFWQFSDWLHERTDRQGASAVGILDLGRYENL